MNIRIYVEGGGKDQEGRAQLRIGFNEFFRELRQMARETGGKFEIICSGGREETVASFHRAVKSYPDWFVLLLVDADEVVEESDSPRIHLQKCGCAVQSANDDQCHLMATIMESWFMADKPALAAFYGKDFNAGALPANPKVEEILKSDVLDGLKNAVRNTSKQKYHKI